MVLRSDSPAGVRFLASVSEGRGIKPSARAAGVGKETGYRWLREAFVQLRGQEMSVEMARVELGISSSRAEKWNKDLAALLGDGRHHLAVPAEVEEAFWIAYLGGDRLEAACRSVGVGRTTGYRWLQARFSTARQDGQSVTAARRRLRLSPSLAARWETDRVRSVKVARRHQAAAERLAVRHSARHVEALLAPRRPPLTKVVARRDRYWELMRLGMSNTAACRMLGVSRRTGTLIRQRSNHQTLLVRQATCSSGRYLSLRERLQIADLTRLGSSIRQVAAELGRAPSTVKRELDRHRDEQGRYLAHGADHRAAVSRGRPRAHKLSANQLLREAVQRKLNRCWSPEEIAGWLRLTHPANTQMNVCAETIYRALLVPGGQGLHKRYCAKLRTGRKLRRSRWLTRSTRVGPVRDMTMISDRPAEVETKQTVGDWEGDLIIGLGSASAMMTLRERKTHYGIVVNLPADHTADSVNAAAIKAFSSMPRHLKRTLTWDQGSEMAKHRALAAATGIKIFFAERSSPWQRGANENFNGLVRQYFPKNTDLSVHPTGHVNTVMRELNARPRKTLGYLTPAALFRAEFRSAPLQLR